MQRYLHSLFCDDIRQEVGNKLSLMGIYQHVMYVQQMPAQLQKLCIVFSASTVSTDPFKSLTFTVKRNEEVIVEQQFPPDDLKRFESQIDESELPIGVNGNKVQTIQAIIILPNITIEEPCLFRVRAKTEREELAAPGLIVSLQP